MLVGGTAEVQVRGPCTLTQYKHRVLSVLRLEWERLDRSLKTESEGRGCWGWAATATLPPHPTARDLRYSKTVYCELPAPEGCFVFP